MKGEDDPDAGEFMVQCETCQVWQHGLCMGFDSEDQLHDGDYYCEQCRPDMHVELLKCVSNIFNIMKLMNETENSLVVPVTRLQPLITLREPILAYHVPTLPILNNSRPSAETP